MNIPAAGSYQIIAAASTPGEAYVAPSMRSRMFKMLFVVASPLIGLALFVVIGRLLAGRRKAAELRQT